MWKHAIVTAILGVYSCIHRKCKRKFYLRIWFYESGDIACCSIILENQGRTLEGGGGRWVRSTPPFEKNALFEKKNQIILFCIFPL